MPISAVRTAPQVAPVVVAPSAPPAFQHTIRGPLEAPIMIICDPPTPEAMAAGLPIDARALKLVAEHANPHGFGKGWFCFVALCPPMPKSAMTSTSREWKHVEPHVSGVWEVIRSAKPKCVVTFGNLASRVVAGRAVQITKARGQATVAAGDPEKVITDLPLFPMLSPASIMRVPDNTPAFAADWASLKRFVDDGYAVKEEAPGHYEWREDISDILERRHEIECLGVDTETTGLVWHDPKVRVLTVQLATKAGEGFVVPICPTFWPEWSGKMRQRARVLRDLKTLLEDPDVPKAGHNLKFDIHMLRKEPLGIDLKGWTDDTQLLAFALDENMMSKSQEQCVLRWAPELAPAKGSVAAAEKANMLALDRERFLVYAGSDPDGVLRLRDVMLPMLQQDAQQYAIYRRVIMPGIMTFADTVERFGMGIDRDRLRAFSSEVDAFVEEEYRALIAATPGAVKLKHMAAKKALSFSRPEFRRDILFTADGFNLPPVVFTKSTADLEEGEREASTSTKDHLPYFADRDDAAGQFCRRLIGYSQADKLTTTYLGREDQGTGLWQYIAPNGRIYPSYKLHATVTGRTASENPNGQNFPKRGRWAKPYQSVFVPTPGYKLINADLSQIELRIAAWMAGDITMLNIYRQNGDIHTATAMAVNGLNAAQWAAVSKDDRKAMRTKAKAVNFGFLYGMGAKKFRSYAKTDYGVDYTEREAYETRERFFATYRALPDWHSRMREEARANGYVRALHGARRNLPSIWSKDDGIRAGAERQAINSPVQRFGSDLGVMAMARFSACADPERFRIIGFVHDALVMEVAEGHEKEGVESLIWAMQNNPLQQWFGLIPPCPILAEGDIGINGQSMLELSELPPVEKQPQWFRDLGLPLVERDGKLAADLTIQKPSWWDDAVDAP